MSFDAAQTAIETRFKNTWSSDVRVRYENTDWSDPKDQEVWVGLQVIEATGTKIELREVGLIRYNGTIILQVFVKKGQGTGRTGEMGDRFSNIFRLAEFSLGESGLIRCRVPDRVPVGNTDNWYQTNYRIEYIRDTYQGRVA